jgi:GNAT superfamily N-acetyltransferase
MSLSNNFSQKRKPRSSIRRSTDADMENIYAWLVAEEEREVAGNFLCNWELTKKNHQLKRLLIYIDGASQFPVAYQWGGLIHSGILQVREDMRGKGIGAKLVARRIAEAYRKNECILLIQCQPASSIPFWKKMGFTLLGQSSQHYAYRILELKFPLPENSQSVNVAIRFYPEELLWDKSAKPYICFSPSAAVTQNGVVHLSERVAFFEVLYIENMLRDVVVEIEVNGEVLFCDKAKREAANSIGLKRCLNGFFIDKIQPLSIER